MTVAEYVKENPFVLTPVIRGGKGQQICARFSTGRQLLIDADSVYYYDEKKWSDFLDAEFVEVIDQPL